MAPVPEPGQDAGWLRTVADEVGSFDRSSTAERVAELVGAYRERTRRNP